MGLIQKVDNLVQASAYRLDPLLRLLPRLVIGAVFIPAGWAKIQSMAKTIGYFQSINIPFAGLLGPLTSMSELVFGFFILIGFYTRLSCLPLMIIMVVANFTAHGAEYTSPMSLVEMWPAMYFVVLACIFALGSGTYSVEQIFSRRK